MKLLLNFLETHSVNYAFTSGILLTVLLVVIILLIVVVLRLNEAKNKLKNEEFFSDVSAQTIEDYEKQIKLQECQIEDRKKYFEDAVVEITQLRSEKKVLESKCDLLYEINNTIKERHDYWKERALHQKHTKKVKPVESEWWECVNEIKGYFMEGCIYKVDNSFNDNLFRLFINENHLHPYLVNKSDFKPVQK